MGRTAIFVLRSRLSGECSLSSGVAIGVPAGLTGLVDEIRSPIPDADCQGHPRRSCNSPVSKRKSALSSASQFPWSFSTSRIWIQGKGPSSTLRQSVPGDVPNRCFSITSASHRPLPEVTGNPPIPPKLPIEKILIANRGEIACRVIQTARRLGIKTVSVFSDADRAAKHVTLADEAVRIGPAPAALSYLSGTAIMDAARATRAHAIHPGYGFLSENVEFADLCKLHNVNFIGPPSAAIHAMGDKSVAKKLMSEAGVPVVPGYHGDDQTEELLREEANRIGYPLLIKATQGGGGKGMRIVRNESEFVDCLKSAQREAQAAFGNSQVLIEKYLSRPRHIEVQIFGDKHKNFVHLYERDCSVQRRHQKIIEEAPAPGMNDDFRKEIGQAAVNAAKAVDYESAGTVEFILDTLSGEFYFMEMNTRLQVEHPITEMVTGQDLVEWQIRVASGDRLPLLQGELKLSGHAFEARIYAENVPRGFLPAVGTLRHYSPPTTSETVRVETGVGEGDIVSVYYDPMIAKLVTWGYDRSAALNKLHSCLSDFQIAGLPTNIPFLRTLAKHPAFVAGEVETGFIDNYRAELLPEELASGAREDITAAERAAAIAAAGMCLNGGCGARKKRGRGSIWSASNGFRLNHSHSADMQWQWTSDVVDNALVPMNVRLTYDTDSTFHVQVQDKSPIQLHVVEQVSEDGHLKLRVDMADLATTVSLAHYFQGGEGHVHLWQEDQHFHYTTPGQSFDDASSVDQRSGNVHGQTEGPKRAGTVTAPMAGRVVKVFVEDGAHVKSGDSLLILEAMKMEHLVKAPVGGLIEAIAVAVGQQVGDNSVLFQIKVPTEKMLDESKGRN